MAYLNIDQLKTELSLLDPSKFAKLFKEIRAINGATGFNDAFIAPERLGNERIRKYSEVFKKYGISELSELNYPLDVSNAFLTLMAEAIERSVK